VHPVRKVILEILKREGHATVGELANRLEMAPVSVRHHLDLLIGDGLVYTPRVRRRSGAGRPQQVYALTPEANAYFPNNYRELAHHSLDALKNALSDDQFLAVMAQMAAEVAAKAPQDLQDLPPRERVRVVADFLTEQGYMAGCELGEREAILHTCHCPYNHLTQPHPELCHMDLILVSLLTGLEPQRIAHIAEGDIRCSYLIPLNSISADAHDASFETQGDLVHA